MGTFRLPRHFAVIVPLVAIGLAACGSSATPFDPTALSQSTDAVLNTLDSSQIQLSMDSLGSKMKAAAPVMSEAADLVTLSRTALSGGFTAWAAQRLQALEADRPGLSVASPQAVIPTLALGKTFTYNPDLGVYQVSDGTGAPSNGVRFLLYAVNPLTKAIVVPLSEIGYVDILDESSGNSNQLHLKGYVTGNGTPLVDYTATATLTIANNQVSGGTAEAKGYISNGTRQVDYDLIDTFSLTSGLGVDYTLSVAEQNVHIGIKGSIALTGASTLTVQVDAGGNTDVVAVNGTQHGPISGTIKHNGSLVINVSGTSDNPTFTDASGNPVTDAQAVALRKVALFIGAVLLHVQALLAPAHALFAFPI